MKKNLSTGTAVALQSIRRVMPARVRSALRPAWLWGRDMRFRARYGFPLPPPGTDLVGYEGLIEFYRARRLGNVPGDLVEIGAFRGGGTYKLAKFLEMLGSDKKVYTIDCFDIHADQTENLEGLRMSEIYEAKLEGHSQRQVFNRVTASATNIVVIAGDSKEVELPCDEVSFAFVDGNHADDYVVNDFYLVWGKLSPGGAIAFHDYEYDLPNVTRSIDDLCLRHADEIAEIHVDAERHVIFIRKAGGLR